MVLEQRFGSAWQTDGGGDLHVLVVDDHRLFADALKPILEAQGMSVAVATSGAEARESARARRPDLILLDLRLRDERGTILGKELLAALGGPVKIVAVTGQTDRSAVREVVTAGFHGFLSKDTPLPVLIGSIQAILDGQLVLPQRHTGPGSSGRSAEAREAERRVARLTPRQWDVLHLLVEGASTEEIGRRLHISIGTVRTHVHSVLSKLQVHTRLEAAAFAVRFGFDRD